MNGSEWNGDMMENEEIIRGSVESIIFQAPDSDFLIFRIRIDENDSNLTIMGKGLKPLVGERLEIKGHYVVHKRYGRQFSASFWQRMVPDTEEGIIRFLSSRTVNGIGPALAQRIVDVFGKETIRIIEQEPQKLLQIEGIGNKKLAMLTDSFYEEKKVNELALALETHGISGRFAGRLLQVYGEEANYVLIHEPYRMVREVDGIGFKTADQIALAFGMNPLSEERLAAGLIYVLYDMTQSGHVCVPDNELVHRAAAILRAEEVVLREILNNSIQMGQLITSYYGGVTYVYTEEAYTEEVEAARHIIEMTEMAPLQTTSHVALFLERWQQDCKFKLADEQIQAVEQSLETGIMVITGGPGTGKTTIIQTIIRLAEQEGLRIMLCAPTGRAAKRLTETTNREALTIHRLLGPGGYVGTKQIFDHNEANPLPADLVIVDEVSMLDLELMYHLMNALRPECRCILVGDADQLPSVGAGAILHDIIRSEVVPVVRLQTVFRQKDGGRIVTNAHLINRGRLPVVDIGGEFQFLEIADEKSGAVLISKLYAQEIKQTGDKFSVQVLSPMYRQECGVDHLNQLIQEQTNGAAPEKQEYKNGSIFFRVGDKVMQKKNDYDKGVFNGDIGEIYAIQQDMIHVRYPEQDVKYEGREVEEITLAYAVTVHKSQGSEYHTVIMALVNSHAIMLQRNLFYTAVTRAKRKVILVGTKKALRLAVENVRTSRRFTLLAQRLREEELC
ncbi:MAG: ATP-dependent RecD-like DNA helicase [Megasphaera sp.]|jgi:exodeoxyribonuclease V alpha subunit|uniref:SF1B family DNA helicase RecD2 n=1 Tax=Megasphaera sueciensis TaxID=349094 RepID=UPI003D00F15A|nr:ATP-dependent RecD-like DNA helicase [Megasphaera sp.]MCI1822750.1 ATP-dependent RecD-like DNA helicase [Megasphaera sp.]